MAVTATTMVKWTVDLRVQRCLENRPLLLTGKRIRGLWEAEALLRALNYDCELMPTSLTEVDMMLLNISKAYGTPLSAMKEFDPALQNVIHKMVEAGLPAEQVPHLDMRSDIRESEFKRVLQENSPYVTFEVFCLLKRYVEAH
jgi:hypothetical protein